MLSIGRCVRSVYIQYNWLKLLAHCVPFIEYNNKWFILFSRTLFSYSVAGFVLYSLSAVSLAIYLIYVVGPKVGQTNMIVYISICSLLGSLSVVFAKGFSIAIRLTLSGKSQMANPLSWFFLFAMIAGITVQMNYLNKALDIFNTALVTPIYYVMFTTLTIVSSAILFKEWTKLSSTDIIGDVCGFSTTICGVFLLHMFKDVNVKVSDLLAQAAGRKEHKVEENSETGIIRQSSTASLHSRNHSISSFVVLNDHTASIENNDLED